MQGKLIGILYFMVTLKGMLLGFYHLYLPIHWQWNKGLLETPEILQWTLMALNDMWSALMILLHGLLLFCFKKGYEKQCYQLGYFLSVYWLIHALIISINPMPLPKSLGSLFLILLAIPYLQCLILFLGASRKYRLFNFQLTTS